MASHRIALSVSPERTVLWDELSLSGSSSEVLWLMPVRPGSTFEVANPAWFDALEAVTRARVGGGLHHGCVDIDTSGGCGCAEPGWEPGFAGSEPTAPSVVSLNRTNTVGPYRTNLISSSDFGALADYVRQAGFLVPPDVQGTIDAYMAEGFDFLAVSVRPATLRDLKPIRVVTPGGTPVLPIRMMAAGAAPIVNVEVYVIAEERQGMPELGEVFLRPGALSWDSSTGTSNYEALETEALSRDDGLSFLTAFASGNPFAMRHTNGDGNQVGFLATDASFFETFAELYFAQGRIESASAAPGCPSIAALLQSELEVTDGPPTSLQLDDGLFACGPMVDLQQALVGLRPARTWLTRLNLELRSERLAQDFLVSPQPGTAVLPNHSVSRAANGSAACNEPIFTSTIARRPPVRRFGWATVPLVLLAAVLRRRFRRVRGAA